MAVITTWDLATYVWYIHSNDMIVQLTWGEGTGRGQKTTRAFSLLQETPSTHLFPHGIPRSPSLLHSSFQSRAPIVTLQACTWYITESKASEESQFKLHCLFRLGFGCPNIELFKFPSGAIALNEMGGEDLVHFVIRYPHLWLILAELYCTTLYVVGSSRLNLTRGDCDKTLGCHCSILFN